MLRNINLTENKLGLARREGWGDGKMGEGEQEASSCRVSKPWEEKIQHTEYSQMVMEWRCMGTDGSYSCEQNIR